jgi:hypothetical protein
MKTQPPCGVLPCLQPITAGWHGNGKPSKNAAALEALRRLQKAGKLDGWLQPTWVSSRRSRQLGKWDYYFKSVVMHCLWHT